MPSRSPSTPDTPAWITGLANAADFVAEWPRRGQFWPCLAAVTLVATHQLRAHHPHRSDDLWVAPVEAEEEQVADHFRHHLRAALARPTTKLPLALLEGFQAGLAALPRGLEPRARGAGARGAWLVAWARRLGWDATALTPDWSARLQRTLAQTLEMDHFLVSRLVDWHDHHVDDPGKVHPMLDFVRWFHRDSPVEAAVMPAVVSRSPLAQHLRRPEWKLNFWVAYGWQAAELAEMQDALADIRQTAPPALLERRAQQHRRAMVRLCKCEQPLVLLDYIRQDLTYGGLPRARASCNATRCYRAYLHALWVRLHHAAYFGPLPRLVPTSLPSPHLP